VYAPVQPALPTISAAGQSELRGSTQVTGRLEGNAAYSPVNHLLLSLGGAWRPRLPYYDNEVHRNRQLELGVGTYYPLGSRWVLQAGGGYGWAVAERSVENGDIFIGTRYNYYARYRKPFGQLGAVYQGPFVSLGLGYRYTQARYTSLTVVDLGLPAGYQLPAHRQVRHEPGAFLRFNLDNQQEHCRFQAECSVSLSLAAGARDRPESGFGSEEDFIRFNRGGTLLVGLGLIYRPFR
jgi:hypothetical protein